MTRTDDRHLDPRVDLALVAATFGDLLHRAGVATTPERSGRFADILGLVAPVSVTDLYWAARLAFVIDRRDLKVFDNVFAHVFRGLSDVADIVRNPDAPSSAVASDIDRRPVPTASPSMTGTDRRLESRVLAPGPDPAGDDIDDRNDGADDRPIAAASEREIISNTSFGVCTPDELEQLGRLIARMPVVPPLRPGRRSRRHRHRGEVDWRLTLRRAHRSGGDAVHRIHRRRVDRPRRIVLIADVSGSMEAYTRAYLYLLHGAVRAVRAEAFVFATRLTRLTRPLTVHDPGLALARAKEAAPDWAGGTRIGESLREFNDRWGRRGIARGAVIVIVSDGWEVGDVGVLAREMERLSRLAHRIVWVNPRRQSATFSPVTGGMAAVLPYVDTLVSGHSLAGMDEVLAAIAHN
jgi:uncharacterized protein